MDKLNFIEISEILEFELIKKKEAALTLSKNLYCDQNDLFYLYKKNIISDKGIFNDGLEYFFHGYDCFVKNVNKPGVELEFGHDCDPLSFDKYRICNMLNIDIKKCEALIDNLLYKKIIILGFEKSNPLKLTEESSIKDKIKFNFNRCLTDRYFLFCQRNKYQDITF